MNLFGKLFIIGIINVFIGAMCVGVFTSGLIGLVYAPIIMLFGMPFLIISWVIVIIMYAVRINIVKNEGTFIAIGGVVGSIISIYYFYLATKNVDFGSCIGFGIGWILSGTICNYLINTWTISKISNKDKI